MRALIDRYINHDSTFIELEHGQTPVVAPLLKGKSELLVEFDARREVTHRQHRNQSIHFHGVTPWPHERAERRNELTGHSAIRKCSVVALERGSHRLHGQRRVDQRSLGG